MAYTNSPLVAYTKLSPNHSGQRTHSIDRITPHCVVGQCTAEGLGDWFAKSSTQASSNYGIDRDGRVGLYVEEKNRSWCSSSNANDQRAITIECASDTSEPYAFRDVVYQKLIVLCADICKRNGKNKLIWFGDKDKTLAYTPKAGEMILTVHRWFANKSCPGNWMYARMGDLAAKVTARLGGETSAETPATTSGLQAASLKDLSEADAIRRVGSLFTADMKKSGILASVSLAQFILESGYGKSELAQNANNCFGMKKSLSGNTWSGSSWDGKSVYTKQTKEQNADGSYVTITADFRKYPCVEDSIADHSAYLLGAKNGSNLRYAGLKGCTDYKKAVQIIKDGGYATSHSYVSSLCGIIERWNLTQYDTAESVQTDNAVLWKMKNGNVICTAMPYGEKERIIDKFYEMTDAFSYPEALRLQFLDEKYKFRKNGDCMILIYFDSSDEEVDLDCSEEELRRKAIRHSGAGILRYQSTSSYVRDRYVSEYAKRRAHGICQLCGKPAPFNRRDGQPFLETHHVIWLADGGDDSIENTVALCPNCHTKMHELNLEEDVEKLLRIAAQG